MIVTFEFDAGNVTVSSSEPCPRETLMLLATTTLLDAKMAGRNRARFRCEMVGSVLEMGDEVS